MEYGKRLNPECSLRTPKGIKGTRQKLIVTHNPSKIGNLTSSGIFQNSYDFIFISVLEKSIRKENIERIRN